MLTACALAPGEPAPSPGVAPAPVVARREAPAAEAGGISLVVADGRAIPPALLLGVLWIREAADPPLAVSPIVTTTDADGALRISELPGPPAAMIEEVEGVGFALGLVIAFHDDNGDGTFTRVPAKPWNWPEFRGGVNEHALVYTSAPVREGTRLHRVVGALPGGLHVMRVALTAKCAGDACAGHDALSLDAQPRRMTLVLPPNPGEYRFPNLD